MTVHAPSSQRTSTRVSREFSIALSARNIRATAHAPRSQRTLNMSTTQILNSTDRFHVVHRLVHAVDSSQWTKGRSLNMISLISTISGSASFTPSQRTNLELQTDRFHVVHAVHSSQWTKGRSLNMASHDCLRSRTIENSLFSRHVTHDLSFSSTTLSILGNQYISLNLCLVRTTP